MKTIYAFIGEDERGSGVVGIKIIRAANGHLTAAAVADHHLDRLVERLPDMQTQANMFGKTIRLVKFEAVEDVVVLEPRDFHNQCACRTPGCGHYASQHLGGECVICRKRCWS